MQQVDLGLGCIVGCFKVNFDFYLNHGLLSLSFHLNIKCQFRDRHVHFYCEFSRIIYVMVLSVCSATYNTVQAIYCLNVVLLSIICNGVNSLSQLQQSAVQKECDLFNENRTENGGVSSKPGNICGGRNNVSCQ